MTRSSLLTLWNSRSRLAVFAGVLALLVGVLRLCRDDLTVQSTGIVYSNSFSNDVDYDLDTLQYMYDLHKGSAHIRPVIEKPRKVHEFWRCLLPVPSYITRNASWVKNGRLYLYSAYYDDRPNSLYPNHHSIQVLSLSFRSMNLSHPLYCNIFDIKTNRYLVVEGTVREIWQRAWDPRDFFYIPNLITCPIPSYFATTDKFTISLTNAPCQAEKAAIAVERMPLQSRSKRDVVVCVKVSLKS
ncbi:hypothetical protein AB6A40_010777 [Gnathostoma spinigerum]|uniref:Uncharacterized protein n=1 Tax=Gnathostoma spinigerum TaxID=75299 RepID=A0ABD6EVW4_9BILA